MACLVWTYSCKRLWAALLLWFGSMAISGTVTVMLLWPVAPVLCVLLLVVLAGVPLLCLTVVGYDMAVGAFPLDTVFGLVPVIVFPPVFYLLSLGLAVVL